MVSIESLSESNFRKNSLDEFVRTQEVHRVYSKIGQDYILVDSDFVEDWDLDKKREVAQSISADDCISYLALDDGKVAGFIGLMKELIDGYMILDVIQVSAPYRKNGIGKKLFEKGREEAVKAGAKGLYISACPSEETIAFYKAMGACVAANPIQKFAEEEPFDLQMICPV